MGETLRDRRMAVLTEGCMADALQLSALWMKASRGDLGEDDKDEFRAAMRHMRGNLREMADLLASPQDDVLDPEEAREAAREAVWMNH